MASEVPSNELPASTHVGQVGLRVGSIDRVRPFYEDAIGLVGEREGSQLVLGPTTEEPLLVLNEAPDAPERPRSAAGLFHVAIRAPDRAALGDAVTRLGASQTSLTGASDHLVSEALYLRDPAGNGIELYRDRPRAEWPDTDDGSVGMETLPLDLDDLESAGRGDHVERFPTGTDVGHVHLEVSDLARAEQFYHDTLGLRLRDRYGTSASFLAAGDYHHHLGLNTWNSRSTPAGGHLGLDWWELALPDDAALMGASDRLTTAGYDVALADGDRSVRDHDGMELRLTVDG